MNFKLFFSLLVIFIICDITYLTFNKKLYSTVFNIKNIKIHFGLIAWIMMTFTIYYFILRNSNWSLKKKIINSAILGFCVYSIYNFTNISVFDFWNIKLAVIDTLWGSFLFAFVVLILDIINKFYKLY
jgi:uncharacterized membrane protein